MVRRQLRIAIAMCDTHRHAGAFIVSSFLIVSQEPAPRFLGMSAAERNRRVAYRHGAVDRRGAREALTGSLPTLWVPAEAAITPDLFSQLPPLSPTDSCRIIWHETHPPMLWRSTTPGGTVRDVVVTAPAVLDVSTSSARQAAAWRLLKTSGKPQDGWLSRHLHRKISRVLSYGCMALGVSANMATMLTFGVGLIAAYLVAQTTHVTMIAGAFLYWFASIADGVDGEVARMKLSESRFGEQLDTGVDQLTHLAALIGVLIGWWRQGIGAGGVALALSVIIGTPATLLWAMTLVRRARRADRFSSSRPNPLRSPCSEPPRKPAHGRSWRQRRCSSCSGARRSHVHSSFCRSSPPNAPRFRRPSVRVPQSSSSRSPFMAGRWIERCEKRSVRAPLHRPQRCQCQSHRPQRERNEPLDVAEQHARRHSVATHVVAEQIPATDRAVEIVAITLAIVVRNPAVDCTAREQTFDARMEAE